MQVGAPAAVVPVVVAVAGDEQAVELRAEVAGRDGHTVRLVHAVHGAVAAPGSAGGVGAVEVVDGERRVALAGDDQVPPPSRPRAAGSALASAVRCPPGRGGRSLSGGRVDGVPPDPHILLADVQGAGRVVDDAALGL